LDLLLYLIQSHELPISKISVGAITDQYVAYIKLMQELNFDTASEFLVMAATLLQWKSKALLPDENKDGTKASAEDEVFTQEDLIRQLLEHQRFRAAGESLAQLPRLHEDVFTRQNPRAAVVRVWKEMNITDLALGYQDMLVRQSKRTKILKKETVSLTEKIIELCGRLQPGVLTEMKNLLSMNPSRPEVVVTFLASLEFSRLKKLRLHQEGIYQPIFLELIETLKDFDLSLASGFNPENPAHPIADVESAIKSESAGAHV
jgi:segregation and condensation protein A